MVFRQGWSLEKPWRIDTLSLPLGPIRELHGTRSDYTRRCSFHTCTHFHNCRGVAIVSLLAPDSVLANVGSVYHVCRDMYLQVINLSYVRTFQYLIIISRRRLRATGMITFHRNSLNLAFANKHPLRRPMQARTRPMPRFPWTLG